MKTRLRRLSDAELKTYPIKGILEGWHFRIEEISQGYFRLIGIDQWGRTVSRDGIDPNLLLLACKEDIVEMTLYK